MKFRVGVLCCISLFFSFASLAFAQAWEFIGPGGGNIAFVVPHPNFESVLYALTEEDDLFQSSDGGKSWQVLSRDAEALDLAPSENALYLLKYDGSIQRQNTDGIWEQVNDEGLSQEKSAQFLRFSTAQNALYLATQDGIFKKIGDETWVDASEGLGKNKYFSQLVLSPDQNTLYAAVLEDQADETLALYFKTGTEPWEEIVNPGQLAAFTISANDTLYLLTDQHQIYQWHEGLKWGFLGEVPLEADAPVTSFAVSSEGTLFFSGPFGEYYLKPQNMPVRQIYTDQNDAELKQSQIFVANFDHTKIYLYSSSGIYLYQGLDETDSMLLSPAHQNLPALPIRSLSYDPNSKTLYALKESQEALIYAKEAGQPWHELPFDVNVEFSETLSSSIFLYLHDSTLYASDGRPGVYFKKPGEVWQPLNDGLVDEQGKLLFVNLLAFHPNGLIFADTAKGIYKKFPHKAWEAHTVEKVSSEDQLTYLSFSPEGSLLYMGNNSGEIFQYSEAEWRAITLSDGAPNALVVDEKQSLYAAYDLGLFQKNVGAQWEGVAGSPLNISSLLISPEQDLLLGTQDYGVWQKKKSFAAWKQVQAGLQGLGVSCLTLDQEGFLYAGTNAGGIYKIQLSEFEKAPEGQINLPQAEQGGAGAGCSFIAQATLNISLRNYYIFYFAFGMLVLLQRRKKA